MIDAGEVPWCLRIGTPTGFSGWPGTDWIEDEVLRRLGPDVYTDWVTHRIRFDDARIVDVAGSLERLVADPNLLHEPEATTELMEQTVVDLVATPARCWLMRMPNFAPNVGRDQVSPDEFAALTPARSPATGDLYEDTALVTGPMVVAFSDRPEVRALLDWLLSPDYQAELVSNGFSLSPIRDFDPNLYPSDRQRETARWIDEARAAGGIRFDGSDMMPEVIGSGRWTDGDPPVVEPGAFLAAVLAIADGEQTTAEAFAEVERIWASLEDDAT